ncbi:MAG TPA: YbhB/YbcL family Raf kinase inhibitor-like protein [Methanomicrobiales archaeon]|nr:YbhB/YbcL family Raf kinase inhibitor-like protein [Methanomicrobiales archaeon]
MEREKTMAFRISTGAFTDGAKIPEKYTCSGADVSPALSWSEPPEGTKSLALTLEDPDAPGGTWYHWLLWNIPGHAGGIGEHAAPTDELPGGMVQGRNSFGKTGYGGPCPPQGHMHRYVFHLYALDRMLTLPAGATHLELEHAMRGHVKGEAQWMGRFER